MVRAAIGDEIVVQTETVGRTPRCGEVLEVLVTGGEEHYRIRWDDGHESLLFPGPDTRIVHVAAQESSVEHPSSPSRGVPAGQAPGPDDPVRTVMATPVATIDGGASLRAVAERLTAAGVGALVVLDHGKPVSVVSERDVVRALADGADVDVVWAVDMMAPEAIWASPGDSVRDVAGIMGRAEVRHVPLRDGDTLVGMVSSRDILAVLAES